MGFAEKFSKGGGGGEGGKSHVSLPLYESLITDEVVKLFSRMGVPEVLHSDQGRNFESALLCQTLEAFGSLRRQMHSKGLGLDPLPSCLSPLCYHQVCCIDQAPFMCT